MSAAIYARVSTTNQELGGQVSDLERELARRGLPLVASYFEKVSATGRVERAEYERLLRDSATPDRPWSDLWVWSLDRLSRAERFTDAVETIWGLERLGIRFHSLKEPLLDTPEDGKPNLGREVLLALLPVLSAWESRRRSERTRVAMRELKEGRRRTRSGRPVGRPRRVTPELVSKAEVLRRQGLPWAEVARRVGLPAETCRRAVYQSKRSVAGVQNP